MSSMKFGRSRKKELTCENCGARAANKHVLACERCGGPIREMNAAAVKEHRANEAQLKPDQQASVERLLQIPGLVRKRATDAIAQLTMERPKGDGLSVEQVNAIIDDLIELHGVEPRNDVVSSLFHMARNQNASMETAETDEQYAVKSPARSTRLMNQRLLCDECGLPYWINELIPRGGRALCTTCAGTKAETRSDIFTAPPPTEAQQAWDEVSASIEREYEMLMQAVCPPGTMRKVAERVLELTRADTGADKKPGLLPYVTVAMREIAPAVLEAQKAKKAALCKLGLRPLGSAESMRSVAPITIDSPITLTPTASKVQAHWDNVNRS